MIDLRGVRDTRFWVLVNCSATSQGQVCFRRPMLWSGVAQLAVLRPGAAASRMAPWRAAWRRLGQTRVFVPAGCGDGSLGVGVLSMGFVGWSSVFMVENGGCFSRGWRGCWRLQVPMGIGVKYFPKVGYRVGQVGGLVQVFWGRALCAVGEPPRGNWVRFFVLVALGRWVVIWVRFFVCGEGRRNGRVYASWTHHSDAQCDSINASAR